MSFSLKWGNLYLSLHILIVDIVMFRFFEILYIYKKKVIYFVKYSFLDNLLFGRAYLQTLPSIGTVPVTKHNYFDIFIHKMKKID